MHDYEYKIHYCTDDRKLAEILGSILGVGVVLVGIIFTAIIGISVHRYFKKKSKKFET